nr:Retrovirus-related Pol polyprotein from transposon TNT 1-94 [Ipomoea batatas]
MEQFHEIVRILGQIRQHGMNMDDSIAIASIIDKLPPSWKKSDDSWWVDTGATRHVCKDINLYKIYNGLEDGPSMYMGNDYMVKVKGIGQVELLLTSGKKLTLTDVYHAPDVRKNLVFGIVLNKCGFKLVFEADRFILSKADVKEADRCLEDHRCSMSRRPSMLDVSKTFYVSKVVMSRSTGQLDKVWLRSHFKSVFKIRPQQVFANDGTDVLVR